jgi:hypothetical protein
MTDSKGAPVRGLNTGERDGDDAPAIAKRLTMEVYRMLDSDGVYSCDRLSAFRDVLNGNSRVLFRCFQRPSNRIRRVLTWGYSVCGTPGTKNNFG